MPANEDYHRLVGFSKHLYRVLLVTYPKEFRREYGADMVQLFRDQCRDELRAGGVMAWVLLWFRTLLELVRSTRRERDRARAKKVSYERETGLAISYNLLVGPGVGQLYNLQLGKGFALLFAYLALLPILAVNFPSNLTTILLVGAGVVWVWSTWDAYRVAKRTNAYFTTE